MYNPANTLPACHVILRSSLRASGGLVHNCQFLLQISLECREHTLIIDCSQFQFNYDCSKFKRDCVEKWLARQVKLQYV